MHFRYIKIQNGSKTDSQSYAFYKFFVSGSIYSYYTLTIAGEAFPTSLANHGNYVDPKFDMFVLHTDVYLVAGEITLNRALVILQITVTFLKASTLKRK